MNTLKLQLSIYFLFVIYLIYKTNKYKKSFTGFLTIINNVLLQLQPEPRLLPR